MAEKLLLKKDVGTFRVVSIAGTMVGFGIFINLPVHPARLTPVLSSDCMGLLWAKLFGGLCYAELKTVIPESRDECIYFCRWLRKSWPSCVHLHHEAHGCNCSELCRTHSASLLQQLPWLVLKCVAAGVILLLAIINSSVQFASCIQVVSMAVIVLALLIILGGVAMLF